MNKLVISFIQLDLTPGCSIAEVNERYRVLASLTHPDQIIGEKKKQLAEVEMKALNDRRDRILGHLKSPAHKLVGSCECRGECLNSSPTNTSGSGAQGPQETPRQTSSDQQGASSAGQFRNNNTQNRNNNNKTAAKSPADGMPEAAKPKAKSDSQSQAQAQPQPRSSTSTTGSTDKRNAKQGTPADALRSAAGAAFMKDPAHGKLPETPNWQNAPNQTTSSKMTARDQIERILRGAQPRPREAQSQPANKKSEPPPTADPDPAASTCGTNQTTASGESHRTSDTACDTTSLTTLLKLTPAIKPHIAITAVVLFALGLLCLLLHNLNHKVAYENANKKQAWSKEAAHRQNQAASITAKATPRQIPLHQPSLEQSLEQSLEHPGQIMHPPFIETPEELAKIGSQDLRQRTKALRDEFRQLLDQIQPPEAFTENNLAGRIPALYKRFNYVDNQKAIFENEIRRRGGIT